MAGSPELQAQLGMHEVSAMHTALEQETLGRETALLSRVLRKNDNQHRRTKSFMRLLEVCSRKHARQTCSWWVAGITKLDWSHVLPAALPQALSQATAVSWTLEAKALPFAGVQAAHFVGKSAGS